MKKRILSLALCLLLLVTAFPVTASGDSVNGCGPNLTWRFDASSGKLTIVGSGSMSSYGYNGAPWTSVRSSIKSISLPSGLTSIGDYAFYGCSALSAVTVPNSVTSIGDSAFDNCTALATVKLGTGVRSIDKWAFYRCGWLTSITLPKALVSIGKYAFYSSTQLKNVYYAGSSTNRAAISIDYCNEYLLNATWHYNYTASKPKITTQPKAVSVKEGAKATFKVVASGATSYQWQYQKPGESSWTNVSSGGTDPTYTLTTAAKHNGYKYRCRVKNSAGTVYSSAVKLTVKAKPKITTQPKAVTVITGAKATFKVSATGATSYQWQYRAKDSSKWVNVKTKGTSAKYTLTTASRHNGYTYRVKITNSVGTVYSNAVKLTVKKPTAKPKITTQPKAVSVAPGQKATFKVVASNAATYQWQYQKKGSSKWVNVKAKGTSASYSFLPTASYNGYSFRCKVTNAKGSVYTKAVKLTVKTPATKPTITTQPKAVSVAPGQKATFKVVATGAASYQWQYQKKGESTWNNIKSGGTSASYTVKTESRHNGFVYRCKVTNAKGSVYSNTAKLTVKPKPKITTQPKSTTVEMGTKATFKVVASNATSYQWQYQKKGESSWSNVKNGGTSASLTVTTESRHDGYKYRCKVTNAVGSVYSSAAKLTVKAPAKYRALLIGVEHSLSWKKNYSEIPDKYRGSYVYVSDWTAPYFYVDVTKRNSSDASRMANMLRGVYGGKSSGAKYQINLRIDPSYSEIKNQIKTTFADTTENDVSLFFIATHGVSDGDGDLVMPFTSSLTSSNINSHLRYEDRLLPFSTLASWLGQYVKGDVIVIIQSCGAGSSIFYSTTEQNGVRTLKAAADEEEAFVSRAIDTFAGLDGTTTKSTGDLRKSRYYVLAAARHHELSYGWENQSDKYNWFTKWLTDGVGKTGSMPADKKGNGNGVVDLVELFNYINQYRTESASSYNQNQHVQYYPVGNKYPLFK